MSKKEKDYTLDDGCIDFSFNHETKIKQRFKDLEDVMSKSVFTEGWESRNELPQGVLASQPRKKVIQKKVLSTEILNDVQILQMRSVLDPKRFYKKDKTINATKNVQVGRVVDSAADFYHSRLPKKQRKGNLVEELMADAKFKSYNKKRFFEILETRRFKNNKGLKRYSKLMRNKNKNKKNR